jgi:peroxiredoxin
MLRTSALLLVIFAAAALGGKYNKKLSIGDSAPTFKSLPGVDGKSYSMDDFKDKELLVLVVTGNECPVAQSYEERLIAFTKKYASAKDSRVAVVALCVGLDPEDRLPKMKERAKEKGFNFPYLHDETQAIGRALGATVTPEFFVLNKERKVVYMGAMDDSIPAKGVKARYLEAALDALLKGEKVAEPETPKKGCSIEYVAKKK